MTGSVHSVYEKLPWMLRLREVTRETIDRKIPVFGICWGHQAVADALDGRVVQGDRGQKIGVFPVHPTEQGKNDPLFEGMRAPFDATSWHGDAVVSMPEHPEHDVHVLAEAEKYQMQSFAIGNTVRTTQFHPEFDLRTFSRIAQQSPPKGPTSFPDQLDGERLQQNGRKILKNWIKHFVLRHKR
jgi:GMP synthase (glutamine-hydrolysing)